MKKYILFLNLLIITILFSGCYHKISSFEFLKDSPSPIYINYGENITSLKIEGKDIIDIYDNSTSPSLNDLTKDGKIVLGYSFFFKYPEGKYSITLDSTNKNNFSVTVKGQNSLNSITSSDLLTKENKYYVVSLKGASYDKDVLISNLIEFDNFLTSYQDDAFPKLYIINEANENFDENTSTLITIENKKITNKKTTNNDINNFISLEKNLISSKNLVHNIDNGKVLEVSLDFTPTKYTIINSSGEESRYNVKDYPDSSTGFKNGIMYFSSTYFNFLLPGNYQILFTDNSNEFSTNLKITSIFNYVDLNELLNQPFEKYYVFFLRDGCSGCNSVKPTLIEYTNNYTSYQSKNNYPLFATHRSQNSSLNIYATDEIFVGVDKVEDIRLAAFPRVILVENGVITKYFKNKGNEIKDLFDSIMK